VAAIQGDTRDVDSATMADQVPDTLKRERLEELLELQRSITLERNERRVGTVRTVLIDRMTGRESAMPDNAGDRGAVGRTTGQALEIDGVVIIDDARSLHTGQFAQVRLTSAVDQDFMGEVVGHGAEARA